MDAEMPKTSGIEADGKAVWSWRPDAGVKRCGAIHAATVATKPVTGESAV
jgi:hypothetical protein